MQKLFKKMIVLIYFFLLCFVLMAQQAPYGGTAWPVPGLIEAENFDEGGEGAAYHDTNDGPHAARSGEGVETENCNEGGYHIAYIETGEWLEYTVNVAAGNYYFIRVRVSSAESGGSFHVEFDGTDVTGIQGFSGTGGWQNFTDVRTGPVAIPAGRRVMRLFMNGKTFNVNYLDITATTQTPTPSPPPTPTPSPTPVPKPDRAALHVEGKWVKDNNNNNVTLRGVATGDLDAIYKGHRSQRRATTVFDIIDIACSSGWYVDVIRLTVHPAVADETGSHGWLNYTPDDYFTRILDPAVQHCIARGKYAIIDWHYVGISWTQQDVVQNTETFWKMMAARYANHPNVIFELFNEPGGGEWSSWQQTAQGWVNMIRNTYNADNLIIIGGPTYSQVMPQNTSQLLSGGNIVYACHIYPAHAGGGNIPNWIDYVSGAAPVIMTEWGYENNSGANVTVGTASGYGQPFRNYIDARPNVGWTAWCFDFVYRSVMFDAEWRLLGQGTSTNQSRFHDSQAKLGFSENTVADTNENYMGLFVKNWLAAYASTTPEPTLRITPTPSPGRTTPRPTVSQRPLGDVNGSGTVDIVDALMTAQYAVGLNPAGFNRDAADVNGDGTIDIVDALMIAQYSVGLISEFPVS